MSSHVRVLCFAFGRPGKKREAFALQAIPSTGLTPSEAESTICGSAVLPLNALMTPRQSDELPSSSQSSWTSSLITLVVRRQDKVERSPRQYGIGHCRARATSESDFAKRAEVTPWMRQPAAGDERSYA